MFNLYYYFYKEMVLICLGMLRLLIYNFKKLVEESVGEKKMVMNSLYVLDFVKKIV